MSYKINEECISCGACETECPNEAITEGETIYVIATDKCTECVGSFDTSRCADVCPVDACIQDEDKAESHDDLMERWKKLHPGETPA
jgi:ferredoxin